MTLLFGLPTALAIGLLLGNRRIAYAAAAAAWYLFLSMQTAYLAHVGVTGFLGKNGLEAVQGPVYWLFQPIVLGLAFGAVWVGAQARDPARRLLARPRTSGARR